MLTDKQFIDWESEVFGFGYGTGEMPVLSSIRKFLSLCNDGHGYSYISQVLERNLTPEVAWLLINTFGHHDIIEYGISPRYAWLTTGKGKLLKEYVLAHTVDELYSILKGVDREEYTQCFPKMCQCNCQVPCNPLFEMRR